MVSGLGIKNEVIGFLLRCGIAKSVRPNNIGKGVWAKIVSQDLDDVARLFGSSSDDVIKGLAKSEVKGLFPKAINKLAYIGALIDAGKGIKDNVDKGSSWERTASDALADLAISGGSIWLSIELGAKLGSWIAPGGGTIVGAVLGLIIGIGLYYATDVWTLNGKTIRDNIKDYISDFFGWE